MADNSEAKGSYTDLDGDIPSIDYRIKVIFNDVSPPEMREFLTEFLEATGLHSDRHVFNQAMYLAQHPNAFDDDSQGNPREPELDYASQHPNQFPHDDPARRLAISNEDRQLLELDASPVKKPLSEHKWRLPRLVWPDRRKWHLLPSAVKHIVFVCGLGATVQGIDEAVVNGAQGLYLATFKIPIFSQKGKVEISHAGPAGLINAAPYLCCVVSCWFTPLFNRYMGRRGTIFFCAMFSIFFAFAQAFAQSWQELMVYRLLMGLGIGPKSATIPIYAAETAPANIRGSLVTCWQAFTALGIAMGCAFSTMIHQWGVYRQQDPLVCDFINGSTSSLLSFRCSWNWRVILAFAMIPPILLAFLIYFCRESPRWTVAKAHRLRRKGQNLRAQHHYRKAYADLKVLSRNDLLAAKDMFTHFFFLKKEFEENQSARDDPRQTWFGHKLRQLFGKKSRRNQRAIVASAICMTAQQLCGVNVLIYYSNYVLQRVNQPGVDDNQNPMVYNQYALLNTMGFGIVNFVFALPAFLLIDMMGRRTLLLTTFPFLVFSHTIMACSAALSDGARENMFLAGFYLFGIFYSPGEGPVPFVYASESMPLSIREEGMGFVTSINWFLNWVVAFSAPYLFNSNLQMGGTFGLYAVLCVILWILILLFVPETRLLTLEQLDRVFNNVSTTEFAEHAIGCLKYRTFLSDTHPGSLYSLPEDDTRLLRKTTIDLERGITHTESNQPKAMEMGPLALHERPGNADSSDTIAERP